MDILTEMTPRQQQLLLQLVRTHIATAEPVASQDLAGKGKLLRCSSATVRNDMAALEQAGYVRQLHTSGGRVPTGLGYRFYVDQVSAQPELKVTRELQKAEAAAGSLAVPERLKWYARSGAESANAAAFVAFSANDYYYTGLSRLFSQPEFRHVELVCSLAEVLDELGQALGTLWRTTDDVSVCLGADCPFGEPFATVVGRTSGGALFGILGPQRLDYDASLGLVRHVTSLRF